MPLNERFVPRQSPQAPGEKGTPYTLHNGLGRFFVAREVMQSDGQMKIEYANDARRKLERAATLAIHTHYWGADDDGQWYPVTYTVANLAFADTRGHYIQPRYRRHQLNEEERLERQAAQHLDDAARQRDLPLLYNV
jgi:hypothetical protein